MCNSFKESVSEVLLCVQFIRGLSNPDKRTKVLLEHQLRPSCEDVVNQSSTLELAKGENTMIKNKHEINKVSTLTKGNRV